jgi:hypothetical protein
VVCFVVESGPGSGVEKMTLEIARGVYMVGGPELSDDRDACI